MPDAKAGHQALTEPSEQHLTDLDLEQLARTRTVPPSLKHTDRDPVNQADNNPSHHQEPVLPP